MKISRIHLPLTGGSLAERLLRNRGRLRQALATHLAKKTNRALATFMSGDWQPVVSQKESAIPISLTSWRPRLPQLPLVLLTLLQQSLRPKEILVWLTKEDVNLLTDETKERFQTFGVRFETCDDLKPHKKWLPMIEQGRRDPFVICDDDIVYPPEWFAALVAEDRADAYVGIRCHRVAVNADKTIASYSAWGKMVQAGDQPSHAMFVTGGGGAVIHPGRIQKNFLDRNEIMQKCPKADDVWLKAAHLAAGIPCYKTRYNFPCLEFPGTNETGLAMTNVDGGGNDEQIRNLEKYFSMISG